MLTHNKLLKLLLYLGYEINLEGMCLGVAMMGIQAMLADDLKSFRERLDYLGSIEDESKIEFIIKETEAKKLSLTQGIKADLKVDSEMSEKGALNKLVSASLSKKDKIILNIKAFFDGIELYFFPYLYPQIFPPNTQLMPKDPKKTYSITAPVKIAEEEKHTPELKQIAAFSGAYTQEELNEYFAQLEKEFSQLKEPVTLLLKSGNHAISVGYFQNKGWVLIDANNLSLANKEISSAEIGGAVLRALSKNDKAIFATEIFGKNNSAETLLAFDKIKSSETWQKLHDLNTKLDYVDSNQFSRLYIAAQNGYINELKSLIENKADIETKSTSTSAFYAAVENNRLEAAHELLINRANVNVIEKGGITPLYIAAQLGHVDMVNRILEEKKVEVLPINADVAFLSKAADKTDRSEQLSELFRKKEITEKPIPGFNALHAACFFGHTDIAKSLLIRGINPNEGKITALEYATAMGHQEIINMISDFKKINELVYQLKKTLTLYESFKNQPAWLALNDAVEKIPNQLKVNDSKSILENLITTIQVIGNTSESEHIKTKGWFGFLNQSTLKEDLEKLSRSYIKQEYKPHF